MKTLNSITTIALILLTTLICSCEKTVAPAPILEESTLILNLMSEPKTKVMENPLQGNQEVDNKINNLDIFVFHNNPESTNHHTLDAHKRIEASETGNVQMLENIEIQTSTGEKTIIAIANSNRENWIGIATLSELTSKQALLINEDVGKFTMSGDLNASLGSITNISFTLTRLVGRVQINSIKTNFTNTPYQGYPLTDIKIYLTNVHGTKEYFGSSVEKTIILNQGKLIEKDVNKCTMPGIIYDQILEPINDSGYHTKHYLYTYENTLEKENNTDKFTRLIIEGTLNGTRYYYPININQEGFGYTDENRHSGIKRNTSYSIDIEILRPGSLDPDQPVEHGTLSTKVNISNWKFTPHTNIEF